MTANHRGASKQQLLLSPSLRARAQPRPRILVALVDVGAPGSVDETYAHKPAVVWHAGALYHYYCAVAGKYPKETRGISVGLDAKAFTICKAPLQGRRHTPNISLFERQTPNRFQFRRWIVVPHYRLYKLQIRLHVR
jgi:hypothetical protein